MTLDEAKKMYQMYDKQYDDIEKRYGTGVRPSWVSTDLAILGEKIRYYKQEMERLSNEVSK